MTSVSAVRSKAADLKKAFGIEEDHPRVESEKEKPNYDDRMDPECIRLCNAINSIDGLRTVESCCGHGESEFHIWFECESLENLPVLLYYTDPCHVGFRWHCEVSTDCAMSPVIFRLFSKSVGRDAYDEADKIACKIEECLKEDEQEEKA